MKLIRLLPFLLLAACAADNDGSSTADRPSQADAKRAFSATSNRLDATARALAARAGIAPLANTVDLAASCELGGEVALSGSFDTSALGTAFDLDATFSSCQEPEGTLDGNLHWTSRVEGASVEVSWNGTLAFSDAVDAWQCTFAVTSIVNETGVHYSGTICGYDVQADIDLSH